MENHTTQKSLHYQAEHHKEVPTAKKLAVAVAHMRKAQSSYFAASANASRTRTPEAYSHKKECLQHSKELEKLVDGMVDNIIQEGGGR